MPIYQFSALFLVVVQPASAFLLIISPSGYAFDRLRIHQRLYLCFQLLEKIRADSLADISIPQNFIDDRADWHAGPSIA
jgi:hypothetical protein